MNERRNALLRSGRVAGSLALGLLGFGIDFGVSATPVSAQSGLEAVEQMTRLGRTEEARAALLDWWDNERDDASRRDVQRGLWLRGRLTVDPVPAELDFQRLALLYPSGQFTPDAVLRLAQASWAMGDESDTRRYLETLERDYRRSDAWERAQEWIVDAGPLPPPGDTPTRPVEPTDEVADVDTTESKAQDSITVEQNVDSPEETEESVAEPVMNYFVQLGAFADFRAFRQLLLQREDLVQKNMVHKLATFALGRTMDFADEESLKQIVTKTTRQRAGLKTMIRELVTSDLFQKP